MKINHKQKPKASNKLGEIFKTYIKDKGWYSLQIKGILNYRKTQLDTLKKMGKYHEDATHRSVSADGKSKFQTAHSHQLSK